MQRIQLIVSIAALALPLAAAEQGAIDFSGTWKMDATRSESAHQAVPIGPVSLIIKQSATELNVETRRTRAAKGGIDREVLTYRLDGTETTATGTNGEQVTCKAHWEGEKLITGTTRNIHGATVTTVFIHTLNPSGNELTVHKTLTVQHGYQFEGSQTAGKGTDVFVKTKVPGAK